VHAQAAVDAGAIEAHEDAKFGRSLSLLYSVRRAAKMVQGIAYYPLWTRCAAVDAAVIPILLLCL
jgi:hypothetical protein